MFLHISITFFQGCPFIAGPPRRHEDRDEDVCVHDDRDDGVDYPDK